VDDVKVSVLCLTYNHERYIKNALDSFLSQKVNFNYEIVVRDDCSIDNTAAIVREYEREYPDIIHGIYEAENKGFKEIEQFVRAIKKYCRGKYIALCEGDDFWLDLNKLQIQIDYMEEHNDCLMSVHNAVMLNCLNGHMKAMNPYLEEKDIFLDELIMQYRGNVPTASMIIRKEEYELDSFFGEIGVGDIPLQFRCAARGKIHYFDRIMSLYRFAHEGSWTKRIVDEDKHKVVHYIKMIRFFDEYDKYTNFTYSKFLERKSREYMDVIVTILDSMELEEFDSIYNSYCSEIGSTYEKYLKKIYKIFHQKKDLFFVDIQVQDFIQMFPNIIIMGAGCFGKRLACQLKNLSIGFNGFAISDTQPIPGEIEGKAVWHLKDIPFKVEETGLVIAMDYKNWGELEDTLRERTSFAYIYPFEILDRDKAFVRNEN
jgi:glycosyltransferase involved in cell wall biosynthesis